MRFDMSFDASDFQRKLEKLAENVQSLHSYGVPMEGVGVPLEELLDPPFMLNYTKFSTLTEMLENGGFPATSNEEFAQIPEADLDHWVAEQTEFPAWSEMLARAGQEWAARKIGGSL